MLKRSPARWIHLYCSRYDAWPLTSGMCVRSGCRWWASCFSSDPSFPLQRNRNILSHSVLCAFCTLMLTTVTAGFFGHIPWSSHYYTWYYFHTNCMCHVNTMGYEIIQRHGFQPSDTITLLQDCCRVVLYEILVCSVCVCLVAVTSDYTHTHTHRLI